MNHPSQEPPDGDFVAYLEALERRQLAALRMQHRLQVDGDPASVEHATTGLRKTETGTVEPQPTRPLATPALPTGAVVALVVGAVLLIAGVFGDGGIVSFVIGLLLLIHGARRLARLRRDDTDARRQALQRIAAILNSPSKR